MSKKEGQTEILQKHRGRASFEKNGHSGLKEGVYSKEFLNQEDFFLLFFFQKEFMGYIGYIIYAI